MKCVRCGTELSEGSKICLGCGADATKVHYENANTSETLESLMEIPVASETLESDDSVLDDAEELNVSDVSSYSETIAGEVVDVETSNVAVGEVFVQKKRKKHTMLVVISVFFIVAGLAVLILSFKDGAKPKPDIPSTHVKPSISNNPTTIYSFGNRIIYRVNSLWLAGVSGSFENEVLESREFLTDGASLSVKLYQFNDDQLNSYIKYLGFENLYEEITVNNVKYYYFAFENNRNYVKIVDNYLYAFEFFCEKDITNLIDEIINSVIFYN